MIKILALLKSLVGENKQKAYIDNAIFQMHYKLTFVFLLSSSIMISSKQYFGNAIECISKDLPPNIINTFCWMTATFTEEKNVIKSYGYYQWISIVLFIQALFFYVPRYLWKQWEDGIVERSTKYLKQEFAEGTSSEYQINLLLSIFRNKNLYAYKYFFCEFLNLINVLSQMFMIDYFLDGEFLSYGIKQNSKIIFPNMSKCTFFKYGYSGSMEKYDSLCMLPLNVLNEKIYMVLWYWLIFLGFLSSICVLYRAMLILFFNDKLRIFTLKKLYLTEFDDELPRCKIGDFFFTRLMSKNLDTIIFKKVMNDFFGRN